MFTVTWWWSLTTWQRHPPTGKTVTVTRGALDATFRGGRNRPLEASGHLTGAGTLDTTPAEAAFSFSLTPDLLRLERGSGRLDGVRITFAGLHGTIPPRPFASGRGFPVGLKIERLNLAGNDLSLEELSGTVAGEWRTTREGGKFEGNGDLTARRFSWRSVTAADLSARLSGDALGIGGDITGTGLGGPLAAVFKVDPSVLPRSRVLSG